MKKMFPRVANAWLYSLWKSAANLTGPTFCTKGCERVYIS